MGDWPAALGLAASAHQAWSANLFTTVSDMFAKKDVASIIGLEGMTGSIGGILFPWYCGRVLDRNQALGNVTRGTSDPVCHLRVGIRRRLCHSSFTGP